MQKTKVNWPNCYAHKNIEGLSLIAFALLCKWIILAFELGDSNLKKFLQ